LPDGNPYPGLAHFDAEHRAVFYGRGADINAVIDRLRGEAVVAVAGDSGIGKSSLCRAGVIPAIEGGALGDLRTWRTRALVVGRRAPTALREALGLGQLSVDASAEQLGEALALDPSKGLLLFIDQFEEILTAGDPASAADAARLLAALAERVSGLKIVISVRGDFLTRVASLPELGPILTRSLHLLRVLGPSDVREAVVGPARALGVRFDSDATIGELTAAVGDDAGALPLLQFALAELWQRRDVDRGIIRRSALDQIGGVAGGLARHADSVLKALGPGERAAARRLLLALVTAEGTRASRDRAELVPAGDPVGAAALEALVRGRLLVARDSVDGEPSYTLAHESLIRAWTTLRGWLDDAAGQRGLRTRLSAAADEWHRRARRTDLLWSRAQLAESAGLDELTERDRTFLQASRRAVRARRAIRLVLLAVIPAAMLATWVGYRLHDQAQRDQLVAQHMGTAADDVRDGEKAGKELQARRALAMQSFDRNDADEAEKRWGGVLASFLDAKGAYRRAAVELETALLVDGTRRDVRARMARVIYERALLAEAEGDEQAAADLVKRLRAYDDGTLVARWNEPAFLSLHAPGAVQIEVRPYVELNGRLVLGSAVAARAGAALDASLAPGSYLVGLRGRDGLQVAAPVLLARGERLPLAVPVPRASQIPDGFVYVPAGRFLYGSGDDEFLRRDFLVTAPLHAMNTGAYLIARHEVTFADWMAYMRDLAPDEREKRRPKTTQGGNMSLHLEGDGPFTLAVQRPKALHRLSEGERLVFPERTLRRDVRWERMPVVGVNFDDARSYASWLARSGRVADARLCSEAEWERAARGADGRIFPHGMRVEQDDANIDVTYQRRLLAFGPDEVGSHPESDSPFGVADLVGNVWEWVPGPGDTVVFRGGGWHHGAASALSTNRDIGDATMRSPFAGVRVCADPPDVSLD
jgi:formylglycine-generating enzyme required for sulfatase activity